MKAIPFILWTSGVVSILLLPLSGQNYQSVPVSLQAFVTLEELPADRPSEPAASQGDSTYFCQRPGTLEDADGSPAAVHGVLSISRRKVANGSESVLTENLSHLSAHYRQSASSAAPEKCPELAVAVIGRIDRDPANLMEVVQSETAANPSCACEIVKAAIQTTDGDVPRILAVVETAVTTAPEHMRLIAQCAIAAAPEVLPEVQALMAKLDPGSGETGRSAKGAKAAVDAAQLKAPDTEVAPNPLDLSPFQFGGAPPFVPSVVTNVNP